MGILVIIVLLIVLLWREKYHAKQVWYYKALINEIPFDSVLLDNKWRFRIISRNAVSDSKRRKWMIGKTEMDYWVYQKSDPEKGQLRKEMFYKALKSRKTESIEERIVDKDGNEKVFLRLFTPLFNRKGKHLGAVGFSYELTQIKQKEHELELLNNELKRSNEDLDSFAHVASHDLKTPLRTIISFLQLFERKNYKKLDNTDREYLDFVANGAKQMNRLINSLLDYSGIGKQKEGVQVVNLNRILESVKLNLACLGKDCHLQIKWDAMPSIIAHDFLMLQLFQNLIGNGIKYNKNNTPTVEIFTKWVNDEMVYAVRDNGIGISKEYQETVFKVFQRLHKSNEYEGSGIGLAACRRIVKLYGGKIWFESEVGKGTTFYFTLPCEMVKENNSVYNSIEHQLVAMPAN